MKKPSAPQSPLGKEPYSIPTEQALLGTILLSRQGRDLFRLAEAMGVKPEHFSYTPHALLWRTLTLAYYTERPFDPPQIFEVAQNNGWGDEIGGLPYLMKLCDYALVESDFPRLVQQLLQYAYDRRLIAVCQKVAHSYSADGDWQAALNELLATLTETSTPFELPPIYSATEIYTADWHFPFLIDPLLPEGGVLLLVGPGGVGKSLLALWMALHLATGRPLFDQFPTHACTVLYLDGESNARALRRRLLTLTDQPPPNLFYTEWSHPINTPEGRAQLEYLLRTYTPACVIVDSLIRFHTLDENKASDMRLFFGILAHLRQRYNTAFLLIHHAGKSRPFGTTADLVRGSTDIVNATDTALFLRRPAKSNTLTLEVIKLRHSDEHFGAKWKIALQKGDPLWFYEFLGAVEDADTNVEAAEKFLLSLLADGPLTRKEVVERARREGYATRTIERALSNLRAQGTVQSRREGRFVLYSLTDQSPPPPASEPLALL